MALDIGLPVVVKPEAGNQGKGVSVNLLTEAEVRAAYRLSEGYRGDVLVERYVEGDDYRLLVVNGRMVAAARRDPASVVGDGLQTVARLVEEVNRDPRRREGHGSVLTRIRMDQSALLVLTQQGLTPESVPEPGRIVRLRSNGNLSTGGTATDVTDEVHPRTAQLAAMAAQILALDVAGIDVICRDIRRPLREQGGAIVEVNAAPGLRMHLAPTHGQPRDVGMPIVDMLYPDSAPARIPIIAITGTNGKTTVTRLIAHIFETARKVVGMTSTEGTFIGSEKILEGDCSGPRSARAVLLHPCVEVAVLETARGGILREGLAFDSCTVGVVTNVSPDHLGLKGVNTIEELARVKQVVVENVRRDGAAVLNAEDPLVAEMAAACDGQVVYFTTDPKNPIHRAHIAQGGTCVYVDRGLIVLSKGGQCDELVSLDRIPFTVGGKVRFQVQNALAATAAAWAAGLNPAMIVRALTTFRTDDATVPGRFNVNEINGVQVVLDYGHNPAALAALGEAVQALGTRRTVMMLALPGDRRDEDIRASVRATIPYADEYVFYDSKDRRGRDKDEVPRMMQACLPTSTRSTIAPDQQQALVVAWKRVQPGDQLLFIADEVDGVPQLLQSVTVQAADDSACETPIEEAYGERSRVGRSSP